MSMASLLLSSNSKLPSVETELVVASLMLCYNGRPDLGRNGWSCALFLFTQATRMCGGSQHNAQEQNN
jgi:hypothetical protein